MAVVIPMSKIYGDIEANLINNNAIDNVQFELNRQTSETTTIPSGLWQSITYSQDKGLFVAVGTNNIGTYSSNGISFTSSIMPSGIGVNWRSITYGNGMFVAVGENANAYSTNGTSFSFTGGNIPDAAWGSVTYGNGVFVAVSYGSPSGETVIAYSTNGRTFTEGTMPSGIGVNWRSITYGNGMFVAVGENANAYSTNGRTFTEGIIPNGLWQSITYSQDKGLFVAVSYDGYTAYSSNGISFTRLIMPTGAWRSITYSQDKGLFVAVGTNAVAYSTDGRTFVKGTIPSNDWQSITYSQDKGLFVAVGTNAVAYSTDGRTFTNKIISTTQTSVIVGSGNNPFKYTGNELLTTNTTYNDPVLGIIPMTRHLGEKIIFKWVDGRMTVRFVCDYAQYFDESGNPTKYTGDNGEILNMQEEIVLWDDRMSRNEPLIRNADGSARKFKVTSTEFNDVGGIELVINALEVK